MANSCTLIADHAIADTAGQTARRGLLRSRTIQSSKSDNCKIIHIDRNFLVESMEIVLKNDGALSLQRSAVRPSVTFDRTRPTPIV